MQAMGRQHGSVGTAAEVAGATPVAGASALPQHPVMECTPTPDSASRTYECLVETIAASADRGAFKMLFEHFAPRLKAYLMRLGCDSATAEELVQEVMLTVWRKAGSYDRHQASAATWIFTIARNRRIDRLRRERRPELDPSDPALVPDGPEGADGVVWAGQVEARLKTVIESLPSEQSDLIRRAYFEDLSHREIAESSGLPLGTVKSRIRLALQRLRERMHDLE